MDNLAREAELAATRGKLSTLYEIKNQLSLRNDPKRYSLQTKIRL